ncbi:MAG: sigma factor-like helix-turn-helix DNA-binding protein [Jatrophihabitans sp.]|uniref:sigma factor-like helix-turn-helix DNA-binding protein n=1 Tax=Jatrophihabitans sp. TaxID=1932789 RepID=UPI003F7F983B
MSTEAVAVSTDRHTWAADVCLLLATLPPEQRLVLQLLYGRRCTLPETAAELGLTVPGVTALAWRALVALGEALAGPSTARTAA